MPALYRIDQARQLVVSTVSGTLTDDVMRAHSRSLASDPDFDPSFRQLMDLRGVSKFFVTSAALVEQSKASPWKAGTQRAFVCSLEAVYGMVRMFELRSGDGPNEIRAFREMSEALNWLRLDEIE